MGPRPGEVRHAVQVLHLRLAPEGGVVSEGETRVDPPDLLVHGEAVTVRRRPPTDLAGVEPVVRPPVADPEAVEGAVGTLGDVGRRSGRPLVRVDEAVQRRVLRPLPEAPPARRRRPDIPLVPEEVPTCVTSISPVVGRPSPAPW